MNHKRMLKLTWLPLAVLALTVQTLTRADTPPIGKAKAVMAASFKSKGQATLARLDQDETQALCSKAAQKAPSAMVAGQITRLNQAAIRYPADELYLGDWARGEKIAQEGRGLQSSDDPSQPVGGNCYACHQLSSKEVAYGTLGPSLAGYGKTRGNSPEMLKYTWAKLFDTKAFVACSNMPRFGHNGILTETQLKDVMALLLDPASPVNQ